MDWGRIEDEVENVLIMLLYILWLRLTVIVLPIATIINSVLGLRYTHFLEAQVSNTWLGVKTYDEVGSS